MSIRSSPSLSESEVNQPEWYGTFQAQEEGHECYSAETQPLTQLHPQAMDQSGRAFSGPSIRPLPQLSHLSCSCGAEGLQAFWLWLGGPDGTTAKPRAWMLTLSHAVWPESDPSLCTVHGLSCEGVQPWTTGS